MSDVVTDSPARGSGREAAICRAALELLAEVGYDRMSMDAVAHRARASKATIYRHWPGKYELVLDALRSRGVSEIAPIDTGTLRGLAGRAARHRGRHRGRGHRADGRCRTSDARSTRARELRARQHDRGQA